jgi:hypothetical protein
MSPSQNLEGALAQQRPASVIEQIEDQVASQAGIEGHQLEVQPAFQSFHIGAVSLHQGMERNIQIKRLENKKPQ